MNKARGGEATMVSVHSVSAEGLIHSIEFTTMQFDCVSKS